MSKTDPTPVDPASASRESASRGEATASGDAGVPGEVAGFGG